MPKKVVEPVRPSAPNVLVCPDTNVPEWEQPTLAAGHTAMPESAMLPQERTPDWMQEPSLMLMTVRRRP